MTSLLITAALVLFAALATKRNRHSKGGYKECGIGFDVASRAKTGFRMC